MLKRFFDISLSGLGLLCLLPVMITIAAWIKLDSAGPVIYKGRRTGRFGKPFSMYKFRTMVSNAETIGGSSSSDTDPRITRSGRLLRKTKLDELPQLFNVLKGDMSLVGPRPEVEEYTRLYSREELEILNVRPGITDYASIRFRHLGAILAESPDPDAHYRDVIRPEKNRLRLEYARQNSFIGDLRILYETLRVVVRG